MATSTDCGQCLTDVIQLLVPDPPISFTVVVPGGTTPAVTEHGSLALTTGVNNYSIGKDNGFTPKLSNNYEFDELAVSNVVDPNVLSIQATVTAKTVSGFTVLLNALPDSDNYVLNWQVSVNTT